MPDVTVKPKPLLDEERLPPVLGDPTQLRQLVMNLVINASESCGLHKGAVLVRTGSAHATHEARVGQDGIE